MKQLHADKSEKVNKMGEFQEKYNVAKHADGGAGRGEKLKGAAGLCGLLGCARWKARWAGRAVERGGMLITCATQGERGEHVLLLRAGPDPQRARGWRGAHRQPPAAGPAADGEGAVGRGQHGEAAAGGEAAPVAAPAAGGLLSGMRLGGW